MTNEITTTDLAKFGHREREMAEELLKEWRIQGLPDDFYDDDVTIMMNTHSGNVFLTNSAFQVAMMNDDKLELFYNCPECGNEGFVDELKETADDSGCCKEYIEQEEQEVSYENIKNKIRQSV